MDPVVLGAITAIILLGTIVYRIFGSVSSSPASGKSHEQKRRELIDGYKRRMDEELSEYIGKPELLKKHKILLLKEMSVECSRNIFFGPDEVRDVIAELSRHEVNAPAS